MNKEIKTLKPFKYLCMTIGGLPTSYLESMSYYETLCWLCKYLENTVNPAINNNAEALKELQEYVTNYFDNLDVQDEIDNKLDEMAENGDLVNIINAYLEANCIKSFQTITELKASDNLANGNVVKTLGNLSYNDGLGNFYLIRTKTNADVADGINLIALTNYNNLIAELIIDETTTMLFKNQYYLKDKKILVIGDSISHEVEGTLNWVKWIRNNYPVNKIDNISYNGAILTGVSGQARNYASNVTDTYDIIIVALGVNDAYHQATLNTLSYSDADYNTFNGSLTYLQQQITLKNPSAKVYFVSPLKNNYEQSNTVFVDVYRSYIWSACNMFGWNFIDGGHGAPILDPYNSNNLSIYLPDGIHPSEAYAPILGQYIVNKMASDGDNSIGNFNSRMNLTSLLTAGEQSAGSSLYCEFKSNGNVKLIYQNSSKSVGSGIAETVSTQLPKWCQPFSAVTGACQIGLDICLGKVENGNLIIYPNTTGTVNLYFSIDIPITCMTQIFESQI